MRDPAMDRRAIESEVLAVLRHHVPKLTSADRWLTMELKADLALESITLVVILVELEERLAVEIGEGRFVIPSDVAL